MGFEAVHAAAAEGDDQELRKCLEGLDKDRNGLFDRENPAPAVVVGKPKGIHGRFNQATPALVAGTMGDTALHKAAERGQVTAVAYILGLASQGLPVAADGGQGPGLHEDNEPIPEDWDDVEKLINAKNHAGETPLHLAATGGSVDCVRLLLDAGSNPIAQDSVKGWTPLHCAASQRHLQVLACLLDAKADPNAVDYQGGTALHTCARYEVEEGLWLLASAGCMLDLQRVTDGYSALHVACKWSNLPFTAMALLHLRADPSLVSRGGKPAALLAARDGASEVLEKVQEMHWKMCLENPDKQGLSKIKAGGQLTVRAAFDKAMERTALRMSNPDDHGVWYNPSASLVTEWGGLGGFDGAEVFSWAEGVPQGRWVSAGPLAATALEEILATELSNAYDLLTSKAGFYTPKEKVKELVDGELSPVIDAIRAANAAWTKAKAAREVFDMEGAEVGFNSAARTLASDWWGQSAEAHARRLAAECKGLRNLRLELDTKMERADKLRAKFQFLEAGALYDSAWGGFGSYGDRERSFEGLYRVEEMRRKAAMKEEADLKVKASQKQVTERAPLETFPFSRLCIQEAVESLERATELYASYGDQATLDTVSNRLTAYKWNLEKQDKGSHILRSGQALMDERVPAHSISYSPTAEYPPGEILTKIRFSDAIGDCKQAMVYMSDIADDQVLKMASDLRDLATTNAALQQEAQDFLQEGQRLEVQYTQDSRLAHLLTFCVYLKGSEQVPVEPYVRHAIDQEYGLTHWKSAGGALHRLQLEEALVNFEAAQAKFNLFDDTVNAQEAQRQVERLRINLDLQGKAHEKMHHGLVSIQERKYGDGHASYSDAAHLFAQIEDEVNAKYAKMLTADAAAKRKLGEEAHRKMAEGLELVELRHKFTSYMQVVSNGLPSFARAEQLFLNAATLFQNLQDEKMSQSASERKNQALERKLHAQELSTAAVVVVQPSGEFAPQRTDKFRRTMPYETAAQAISDAATFGKTSTYHTQSEILPGSTVYLRAGQHELEETLYLHHNVVLSAEDTATAQDCSLIIKKRSLIICDATLCKISKLNLRQLQGDGAEDYWTGGLFVVKVEDGAMELQDCLIHSQRGTGIVATSNGSVLLNHCNIFDCGHYGIGADGANAFVDVRDCSIEACKFEEFDERNGGKVVGVEGRD